MTWNGLALATRIMEDSSGAMTLWNHDAFLIMLIDMCKWKMKLEVLANLP